MWARLVESRKNTNKFQDAIEKSEKVELSFLCASISLQWKVFKKEEERFVKRLVDVFEVCHRLCLETVDGESLRISTITQSCLFLWRLEKKVDTPHIINMFFFHSFFSTSASNKSSSSYLQQFSSFNFLVGNFCFVHVTTFWKSQRSLG